MKRLIVITGTVACLAIVFIYACSTPKIKMQMAATKVVDADRNFNKVDKDVVLAKNDSAKTYNKFRADAIFKLSRNNSNVALYRNGIDTCTNASGRKEAQNNADSLITENNKMIVRLDNSIADKDWNSNKRNFNNDLDKLSGVITGLVSNSK